MTENKRFSKDVDLEGFEAIVDANDLVILDFWADWCQPCKVFSPIFERMAEVYTEIYFGKVNTEVATELAAAFLVRSVPTIMAFKKGDLVFEQTGLIPAAQFAALIEKLFEDQKSGQ